MNYRNVPAIASPIGPIRRNCPMLRRLLFAAAIGLVAAPAFAQDQAPLPSPEEINAADSFIIAGGGAIIPDYEGSDDYQADSRPPRSAAKSAASPFTTRGTYLYVDVVNGSGKVDFDVGPIAGVRLNRTSKIKDDIVNLLPDRKTAVEVGGFAGVSFKGLTNPYDSLGVRLDVVKDIASAHQSTIFSPNVEFSTPLSHSFFVSASVSRRFRQQPLRRLLFQRLAGRSGAQRPARVQRRRRHEELEGRTARQLLAVGGLAARPVDVRHGRLLAAGRRLQALADRVAARQRQPVARRPRARLQLLD